MTKAQAAPPAAAPEAVQLLAGPTRLRYDGRDIEPGAPFTAHARDARVLVAIGCTEAAAPEAAAHQAQAEDKAAGTYKTRDMAAQTKPDAKPQAKPGRAAKHTKAAE